MARQIQLRRGTAIQHTTFTGANGEVTVDTTNKTLRVHDGTTPGGTPLARADSVTDMSGADYVVAWQTPTDQNNYTWYRKYKSGWVEQGQISKNCQHGIVQTVNIPVTMADIHYTVKTFCTQIDSNGSFGALSTISGKAKNSTQILIGQQNEETADMNIGWEIKGMSA